MSGLSFPKCWALVSGGKDSLSTAQALDEAGKLEGCVAFETGVSTPDWKDFVVKTCQDRKWRLEFHRSPESYDDLVLEYGFPGPGRHKKFMDRLKGRCVRLFRKQHPDAILASGTRSGESKRREIGTAPISHWEGAPIIAPIYDWSTDKVWEFFHDRGFERAPAYSTLQISGDCLCGAFAREGEREALEFHYPAIGERFRALTAQLGHRVESGRNLWGWGWKQPVKKDRQTSALCVECGDADPSDPQCSLPLEEQPA
jgi:3'-phosphoadenosine 5'-phosphosulfate sulfotransferase (PAPS reductase)/FAD synthetase